MKKLKKVNRVEIITKDGRQYVGHMLDSVELSYQDDGRTLKIFIDLENKELC